MYELGVASFPERCVSLLAESMPNSSKGSVTFQMKGCVAMSSVISVDFSVVFFLWGRGSSNRPQKYRTQ